MYDSLCLQVPNCSVILTPGCKIKLGRFESEMWEVRYGWYSWGGNRPVCGWFLVNASSETLKPLQKPDLDDIYLVEH